MKVFNIRTLAFLLGMILFFSACNKEESSLEDDSIESKISQGSSNIDLEVESESGLLVFENLEEFTQAMEYLSDSEERFFTDDAFIDWESNLNFSSMRSHYQRISDEFEKIDNNLDLEAFKSQFGSFLTADNDLSFPIDMVLASIIDLDGRVVINNTLHCFTGKHQIIIMDKSNEKLNLALSNLTTNEEEGIFVLDLKPEQAIERGNCGKIRQCAGSNGSKRVNGKWELQFYASPLYNYGLGFPYAWQYTIDYYCEMKSERKKWIGWGKNHGDDIQWGTGYGVMSGIGSITHGTGWTQNSWKITYFKRLFPIQTTPSFSSLPSVFYQFSYNNTTLNNLNSSGANCEDDCF